jgi:hypothetical protein
MLRLRRRVERAWRARPEFRLDAAAGYLPLLLEVLM